MAETMKADTLVTEEHFVLNSGAKMPALGLGTWQAGPNVVRDAVFTAIVHAGYRHIDAASAHANQEEVGAGLRAAFDTGIKREDVFITSKLWINSNSPEKVKTALRTTLSELGLDYLDLYLVHWPIYMRDGASLPPQKGDLLPVDIPGVWKVLEGLVKENLLRNIGVSNFTVPKLELLLKGATILPAVHQVEMHPAWRNDRILEHANKNNYHVTAYSRLGTGALGVSAQLLDEPVVIEVAKKLDKSPSQILLRCSIQRGVSVIPQSSRKQRIKENMEVFGWSISAEDIKKISSLPQNRKNLADLLFVTADDDKEKVVAEFWDGEL